MQKLVVGTKKLVIFYFLEKLESILLNFRVEQRFKFLLKEFREMTVCMNLRCLYILCDAVQCFYIEGCHLAIFNKMKTVEA